MLRYLPPSRRRTDLTAARASALSVVVFGGPTTIGDLATAEQVSPPTMTKLVTSLEGEGLVRRVADERDRRAAGVHSTPQAARILRRGRAARVRVLAATLKTLHSADLTTLGRAADILRKLEQQRRQPAPGPGKAVNRNAQKRLIVTHPSEMDSGGTRPMTRWLDTFGRTSVTRRERCAAAQASPRSHPLPRPRHRRHHDDFSVVHAAVIHPFPYQDSDTLMSVNAGRAGRTRHGSGYTIY